MNINPFELMKNAKDLQTHFGKMQEELAALRVQGDSDMFCNAQPCLRMK